MWFLYYSTDMGSSALFDLTNYLNDQHLNMYDYFIFIFVSAPCSDNEYKCYNQRCIPERLRCSGFDHCGDRTPVCLLTNEAKAAVGVTAVLILIAIIVIVAIFVWRKKRQTTFNDRVGSTRCCKLISST
jgi:hypothetical protein